MTYVTYVLAAVIVVLIFLLWKARYTRAVRQDAIQRSLAVTAGKVYEQLVPYLPNFPFNPRDARFLGSPVDFVVFDGVHLPHADQSIDVVFCKQVLEHVERPHELPMILGAKPREADEYEEIEE
jgi:hypothetical protein